MVSWPLLSYTARLDLGNDCLAGIFSLRRHDK
jgi:hypothetical protein